MAWWEPTTGSFTVVAAYQPIGAANLAASYVNLANPGTYDTAPGDAPTFDVADGWTFNGSSDYLTTGITPGSTWTILVRYSNRGSGTVSLAVATAAANTAPFFGAVTVGGNQWYIVWGNNGAQNYAQSATSGVIGQASNNRYFDGAAIGALTGSWTGTPQELLIGGQYNTAPTVYRFWSGKIQAVAIYSTTLDATQMAEISANMAELPVIVISGKANITQAGDTLSSSGALALAGAVSITEADSTLSATGAVSVLGMVSVAQADDALSASGALAVYGQFAVGQFGDTLVADGTLALAGEAVLTQSDDTLYATVGVVNYGSAAIMQASNTLSAAIVLNRFRSRYRGTVRSIGNIRINEV